jgi:hypothetical protein
MIPPRPPLAHLALLVVASLVLPVSIGFAAEERPTIEEKTKDWSAHDGLVRFYKDEEAGKIWLEAAPPAGEGGRIGTYLYYDALLSGLGSNPVGLDRGQLGPARLVDLRLVGGRLLIEEQNLRYRARSPEQPESRAVRESFATSILWAGEVAAAAPDGSILVDLTSFLIRDAHDVVGRLREADQGAFSLDKDRSVVDLESCLAFPDNVEFEALLTYAGSKPGNYVVQTTPMPQAITLVQHHSFLRLPDAGFRPRPFDPRAGAFGVGFSDYAAPLEGDLHAAFVERHRLERVDLNAERSAVKEPIVYYVDHGIPEPVRSAVIEGAGWWAQAFEQAGLVGAYRVELLPPDVHPLDARYNVIQWVHRSTRGWSYGGSVVDPRTGEIIKGHVTLGSLRVRHDRLMFEGLAGADRTGSGGPADPVELSLARIRQLSAHEVGHTLGLAHNFAASTYGGRASVMDYPAPLISIREDGSLDFSNAYGVGTGVWDVQVIRYLYGTPPPRRAEQGELQAIILEGIQNGYAYLSDRDARVASASQPIANLWDNGTDPVGELVQTLRVREIALGRFGEQNVAVGAPLARLQEVLAPLYFHHRYQLTAAAKTIGGMEYEYATRGDGQPVARFVDAERQRRAIEVIVGILSPEVLDLPDSTLALLLPRVPEAGRRGERLASSTAPAFDALGAAATAAELVLIELLQPQRAARMIDFHRRDENLPSFTELLEAVSEKAFKTDRKQTGRQAEIQRVIQEVTIRGYVELAEDPSTPALVRSQVDWHLERLLSLARKQKGRTDEDKALRALLMREVTQHFDRPRPQNEPASGPADPPPGSPIGVTPIPGFEECSYSDRMERFSNP